MAVQRSAQIQVLLEGVPVPANKQRLVEYARTEDAHAADALEAIPDREYRSLDEVGEALASVAAFVAEAGRREAARGERPAARRRRLHSPAP